MYGKMLVLTFEDNEDAMMNRILSLINTKEEVIQIGTKRHPDRKGQYQSCNWEIQCHDNEDLWIYLWTQRGTEKGSFQICFWEKKPDRKGWHSIYQSIHQSFRIGTKIRGSDRIGDIAETKEWSLGILIDHASEILALNFDK